MRKLLLMLPLLLLPSVGSTEELVALLAVTPAPPEPPKVEEILVEPAPPDPDPVRGVFIGEQKISSIKAPEGSPPMITPKETGWVCKYMRVTVTAYDPGPCCTPGLGLTKTGRDAGTVGVAVDPSVIPLGARLDIEGYGNWILADDTGGAIKGRRLDVRMQSHRAAKRWGKQQLSVRIWSKKKED